MEIVKKLTTATVFIALMGALMLSGAPARKETARNYPFLPISLDQADSLMATLSEDERLRQFFVYNQYQNYAGGALFTALSNLPPLDKTAKNHSISPLIGVNLLSLDWNEPIFPRHAWQQLSSLNDAHVIYDYAYSLGSLLHSHGVDFVVGPSLDVVQSNHSSHLDPFSFGDDPAWVAEATSAFVGGMQTAGIMCIAGSFPGIGNSQRSFDVEPPLVYSKRTEFNQIHLVPFKHLINEGLQNVLFANAFVPGMDSSHLTTAANSPIVHDFLHRTLGFNGLMWSDVQPYFSDEATAAQQSFLAGNNMIITHLTPEESTEALKVLIAQGVITWEDIDLRCKRVLQMKLWSARKTPVNDPETLLRRGIQTEITQHEVCRKSMVLAKNDNLLPLKSIDSNRIAWVSIGDTNQQFTEGLVARYAPASHYFLHYDNLENDFNSFLSDLENFDQVALLVEPRKELKFRGEISEHLVSVIERTALQIPTTLLWLGPARSIRVLQENTALKSVVIAHGNDPWTADYVVQAYFGGRELIGQLRKRTQWENTQRQALTTSKIRLGYGLPEEVGIDRADLKGLDDIAAKGIKEMAYPGCQVWFAKDEIVVVNKSYGHHTYQLEREVQNTDMYDLASITKIAGSVAGLMKLSDQGKFNLNYSLCDYLGEWVDTTDYMQLNMREILAHQAGLTPFISFQSKTLSKGVPRYDVYSIAQSETYPNRVARELYIRADYSEKMFRQVVNHKLSDEKKYVYSDIGYYFMMHIIEKQSGMTLDRFLDSTYYRPLGLTTMGYKPLDRFDKSRIAPTEYDKLFRNQLIHGDVHDPGAAMLGGVGGHAGLFSNANDLGILMQMYLNGGTYGGKRYFSDSVIADYVRCQFCDQNNRRGAGFDKPLRTSGAGPSCGCTSIEAFGHQGFTGTVTWADPGENVVYVFLSNRVYPDANNKKLAELNIRTDMQKEFYKAIEKGKVVAVGTESSPN